MRLITLLLSVSLQFVFITCTANPSTDSILSRYRQYLLNGTSLKDVDDLIPSFAFNLTSANQWADIDYADVSPSYWQIRNHIERVRALSIAWSSPGSRYFKNQDLWNTLSRALDNWLEKRYKNSNWWVNEIGVPQDMRDILVFVGSDLSPAQRSQALEVLGQHKVRGVGANLIWSADLAIHYGALVNDEEMIKRSVALISSEIKVTSGEGIQPDYSYHQHETRLQIYHYGKSFLETYVRIAWEMLPTPWSFPREKIDILTDFILNGWQWMSRGINTVPGTIDRAASRQDQLHNADLRQVIPYLCDLNPSHTAAFVSIANRQNGNGEPLLGFRYFPYSDFTAYHQNDFSFFLKTISTRTSKSESINTENLKGRLLNNGDSYVIENGNEYFNMMPVWNWNFLPGQTNVNSSIDTILRTPYAGSVSDGNSGLSAMDYALSYKGKKITAHKAWACHGDAIVCLIGDLKASGINDSVFTALDQSRWQTTVEVNKPGSSISDTGINQTKNVRWIYHSNVGYILLQPSTVQVQLHEVTSSWSSINQSASAAPVTGKVFMPLLYNDPKDGSSAGYVIMHANTSAEVEKLALKPAWRIIGNTGRCLAVQFNDGVVMAAFFHPSSIPLVRRELLKVDKPCLIQVTDQFVYISDPLHEGGTVNFSLNGKAYNATMNKDGTTVKVRR